MAQDKYKPQLTLIKGGKLKKDDAPEEYMALCGELAGCILEFIQHEVGMAEFSQKRKAITEKMEEFENTLAAEAEVEELEPPTFASDEEEAEWYRERAEWGNPFAQEQLGDMYWEGSGVPEDEEKAREWWRKAADGYRMRANQGDADAQFQLGLMHWERRGVPYDTKQMRGLWYKAADGYRERAERGDTDAVKKLRRMAEWGLADNAHYHLGVLAETGHGGVRKNRMHASAWYRKAAKEGHKKAKEALERLNS